MAQHTQITQQRAQLDNSGSEWPRLALDVLNSRDPSGFGWPDLRAAHSPAHLTDSRRFKQPVSGVIVADLRPPTPKCSSAPPTHRPHALHGRAPAARSMPLISLVRAQPRAVARGTKLCRFTSAPASMSRRVRAASPRLAAMYTAVRPRSFVVRSTRVWLRLWLLCACPPV